MVFLGSCSFSFPATKQAMEKKKKNKALCYSKGLFFWCKQAGETLRWDLAAPVWGDNSSSGRTPGRGGPGAGVCGSEGLQSPWCGVAGWEPWRVSPSSCAQGPGCPRLPWRWRFGCGRYPMFIVFLHEIEVVFPSRAGSAEKLRAVRGTDLVHPGIGVMDPLPCQNPEGRAVSLFLFAGLFWLC